MNTPFLSSLPKTSLAGLLENWRRDLQAGFLVFLIALPLCLDAVQALGEGDAMGGYRYTLAAIMVAMPFAGHFDLNRDAATGGPKFLVSISEDFSADFYFPDFSKLFTLAFWEAVIGINLVGSLESLLSTTAVDKLDPYQRTSDLDRDLTAVGIGNMAAGLIGGFPMIAEIVRSSENVNHGAKTAWANFFHGLVLLLFVVLFPHLINNIPLASWAALLVYTGYRLASPATFAKTLETFSDHALAARLMTADDRK
jgi:MFS superfamily sulfate permease-like transporter